MFELSLVVGVLLVTLALAVLLDTKHMQKVFKDIVDKESSILLAGSLNLVLGVAMLTQNHLLSFDFPGLFALVGWLSTLKGVLAIWFPTELGKFAKKKLKKTGTLQFAGLVHLALGGSLLYFVYLMVA